MGMVPDLIKLIIQYVRNSKESKKTIHINAVSVTSSEGNNWVI